jgi:hypothetical protein
MPLRVFCTKGRTCLLPLRLQTSSRRGRTLRSALPSPILTISTITARRPVTPFAVVLFLQRRTIRPSWLDWAMGLSISWNSAFENQSFSLSALWSLIKCECTAMSLHSLRLATLWTIQRKRQRAEAYAHLRKGLQLAEQIYGRPRPRSSPCVDRRVWESMYCKP